MRLNRWAACIACSGFISIMGLFSAFPAFAGWEASGSSWTYVNDDGSLRKGWLHTTDGKYYYMDDTTGLMTTGWTKIGGYWYYFDPSTGAMQAGWV